MKSVNILIMSDSTGYTGEQIAKSLVSQFEVTHQITRFGQIEDVKQIEAILKQLAPGKYIVVLSLVSEPLRLSANALCAEYGIRVIDLFDQPLRTFEEALGMTAKRLPGLIRELDSEYFDMIDAIEFAVKYDDGRDARGLTKADIVLIGVSRTSKTPLSMLLAYKNYRVANLPLVPEIKVPPTLYEVDPKRIFGLIIDESILNQVRMERLKSLGISPTSNYAKDTRIQDELRYATDLMKELGCTIINVSDQTIEETASIILTKIRESFPENLGHRNMI